MLGLALCMLHAPCGRIERPLEARAHIGDPIYEYIITLFTRSPRARRLAGSAYVPTVSQHRPVRTSILPTFLADGNLRRRL